MHHHGGLHCDDPTGAHTQSNPAGRDWATFTLTQETSTSSSGDHTCSLVSCLSGTSSLRPVSVSPRDEVANGLVLQSPRICQLHVYDMLCTAKGFNTCTSCPGQSSRDSYVRECHWPFLETGQSFITKSSYHHVICARWVSSNQFSPRRWPAVVPRKDSHSYFVALWWLACPTRLTAPLGGHVGTSIARPGRVTQHSPVRQLTHVSLGAVGAAPSRPDLDVFGDATSRRLALQHDRADAAAAVPAFCRIDVSGLQRWELLSPWTYADTRTSSKVACSDAGHGCRPLRATARELRRSH